MTGALDDARRHLRHGAYGAAESAARQAMDGGADGAECWLVRGRADLERGRTISALDCFDRAVAADPQSPAGHAWRVAAMDRSDRDDEARMAVAGALATFPDNADVLIAAGRLESKFLDYVGAVERFQEAYAAAPDDVDALAWYVAGLRWNSRYDEARDALVEPLRGRPDDQVLLLEDGDNLTAVGRRDEALVRYRAAHALDREDLEAIEDVVGGLRDTGRRNEAEPLDSRSLPAAARRGVAAINVRGLSGPGLSLGRGARHVRGGPDA